MISVPKVSIPTSPLSLSYFQKIPGLNTSTAQVLSHPTWDLILIFVMIAIGFFYGIARGRHKMVSSVLNTYVALAVFNAIPIQSVARYLRVDNIFIVKTAIFFAIFFPLVFLMNRGRPRIFRSNIAWWQVFFLSFIQTGLLIHIVFSFLPLETAKTLAPLTRSFFANTNLTIWWLGLPLIFLIFLRRSGRDD